jgi:hypothetical protein
MWLYILQSSPSNFVTKYFPAGDRTLTLEDLKIKYWNSITGAKERVDLCLNNTPHFHIQELQGYMRIVEDSEYVLAEESLGFLDRAFVRGMNPETLEKVCAFVVAGLKSEFKSRIMYYLVRLNALSRCAIFMTHRSFKNLIQFIPDVTFERVCGWLRDFEQFRLYFSTSISARPLQHDGIISQFFNDLEIRGRKKVLELVQTTPQARSDVHFVRAFTVEQYVKSAKSLGGGQGCY